MNNIPNYSDCEDTFFLATVKENWLTQMVVFVQKIIVLSFYPHFSHQFSTKTFALFKKLHTFASSNVERFACLQPREKMLKC